MVGTPLAHDTEWLMSWFINPPNDSTPGEHEWVGPAPRLFYEDGSAAYAAFRAQGPDEAGPGYPAVTFAPTTMVREPLVVRTQIRIIGASSPATFSVGVGIDGGPDPEYPPAGWDFTDLSLDTGIATVPPDGEWHTFEFAPPIDPFDLNWIITDLAPNGRFMAAVSPRSIPHPIYHVSLIEVRVGTAEGRLAIDTHDHPFHVVGTRDPAMPYELVINTGTQRLVEIVAGEESLATHELVIDETGRAGDPWTHCGLFRPI